LTSKPRKEILHLDFVFHWGLLDNNCHSCESLADLSYPVVLLQGCKSGGDRFIESFSSNLYGMLNVSDILHRNCACSEDHKRKRTIFAFCSLRLLSWLARQIHNHFQQLTLSTLF